MLNWSKFQELAGGQQHNFEMLWRSAIRLRYGRFGQLGGLANQPGVEFHLQLHTDCDLGNRGNGLAGSAVGMICQAADH